MTQLSRCLLSFRYSGTYQWSSTAPMRCNQDNQREYEERCFRQIARHLLHENGNADAVECSRILAVNVAAATAATIADPGQRAGNMYINMNQRLQKRYESIFIHFWIINKIVYYRQFWKKKLSKKRTFIEMC